MFGSLLILLILPLVDKSRLRGGQFRPLLKFSFWFLVSDFFILMWIGSQHPEAPFVEIGQIATGMYFAWFIFLTPIIALFENSLSEFYLNINNKYKREAVSLTSYNYKGSARSHPYGSDSLQSFILKYSNSYNIYNLINTQAFRQVSGIFNLYMIFLAIIIVLNAIWGIFLIINSINFDIISQGSYLYLYDLNNFDFSLENFEQIQVAEPNRIEIKNIFFSDNNNTNMNNNINTNTNTLNTNITPHSQLNPTPQTHFLSNLHLNRIVTYLTAHQNVVRMNEFLPLLNDYVNTFDEELYDTQGNSLGVFTNVFGLGNHLDFNVENGNLSKFQRNMIQNSSAFIKTPGFQAETLKDVFKWVK